jgi:hypothetical protein
MVACRSGTVSTPSPVIAARCVAAHTTNTRPTPVRARYRHRSALDPTGKDGAPNRRVRGRVGGADGPICPRPNQGDGKPLDRPRASRASTRKARLTRCSPRSGFGGLARSGIFRMPAPEPQGASVSGPSPRSGPLTRVGAESLGQLRGRSGVAYAADWADGSTTCRGLRTTRRGSAEVRVFPFALLNDDPTWGMAFSSRNPHAFTYSK